MVYTDVYKMIMSPFTYQPRGWCNMRKIDNFPDWKAYDTIYKYKTKFIVWKWKAIKKISRREGHPDRMWENICEADGNLESVFA
jgi:hypothetical protein